MLFHQFDGYDDGQQWWKPPWEQCTRGQCYRSSDRLSAMLVSQSMAADPSGALPLYSTSLSGLILSPRREHNHLLCSYPYDAGTAERNCWPLGDSDWCSPGCTPKDGAWGWHTGGEWWCNQRRGWPCAWPPDALSSMLEVWGRIRANPWRTAEADVPREFVPFYGQKFYNEIVLEFAPFSANMPRSVEAIFYIEGECDDARPQPWLGGRAQPKCEEYARWVHQTLQETWPSEGAQIPLLRLDLYDRANPFRVP